MVAVALTLASLGPWSAQAVSRRDQSERLRAALTDAGLLRDGRLTRALFPAGRQPTRTTLLPATKFEAVNGTLNYLFRTHGPGAVSRVMGAPVDRYEYGDRIMTALAVGRGCERGEVRNVSATLPGGTPLPAAAGTLYELSGQENADTTAVTGLRMRVAGSTATVERVGNWRARVDLAPIMRRVLAQQTSECSSNGSRLVLDGREARIPLVDEGGTARGELIVTSAGFTNFVSDAGAGEPRTGPMRVERVSGLAILRD